MKALNLLFAIILLSGSLGFAQAQDDRLQIQETVLNYLEGMENNDPVRMEKAMHPDLAKRTVNKNGEGIESPSNMTAASLIGYTKDFDYTQFYTAGVDPNAPLKSEVHIYDISNGIATVKATTNKFEFEDYIHLAKMNGEWKIVNILWAWTGYTCKWFNK